jgi:hypothetical protein
MTDATRSKPTWRPRFGVGIFDFGASIANYSNIIEETTGEDSPTVGQVTYEAKCYREVFVRAERGTIVSVDSYSEFWLNETNVIGSTLDEAVSKIGQSPDEVDHEYVDGEQTILYFYDLGLTVWLENGLVETVQASSPF